MLSRCNAFARSMKKVYKTHGTLYVQKEIPVTRRLVLSLIFAFSTCQMFLIDKDGSSCLRVFVLFSFSQELKRGIFLQCS